MKIVEYSVLTKQEKELIEKAIKTAKRSNFGSDHKVGCVILCENGDEFYGATMSRTKAVGSTCAERMAVDQLYFNNNKKPRLIILTGLFNRKKWTKSTICTPCGICLEMFFVLTSSLKLKDLNFLCSSWNKKRILRIKLSELYPQIR